MIKGREEILNIFESLLEDRTNKTEVIWDYITFPTLSKPTKKDVETIKLATGRDLKNPDNKEYFLWYLKCSSSKISQLSDTISQIYHYGIDESDDNLDNQEKWQK